MGVTIILVVAAEMIGGSSQGGMGWLLISSGQVMETEKVFASLIVLAVVGAVVIKLQQWIDRKVAPWVVTTKADGQFRKTVILRRPRLRGPRRMTDRDKGETYDKTGKGLVGRGHGLCAALGATASGGAADVVRVGEGPFITGGGFFIAREKGYFKKLNLEIETKRFEDGAFAVPSMIAGELEFTLMTANASLFNSVAKGAPLVVILDRGHNRPGFGYTVVNVTQALYDEGVRSPPTSASSRARSSASARSAASTSTTPPGPAEGRPRSRQGRAVDRQRAAARPHAHAGAEPGRRHRPRLPVRPLRPEQQMGPDRRQRR